MSFMRTAVSPGTDERMAVETQLRAANNVLGMGPAPRSEQVRSVEESKVIAFKPEYGLLVLDTGEGGGARVGTPLQVMRKDRVVATTTHNSTGARMSRSTRFAVARHDSEFSSTDPQEWISADSVWLNVE